MVGSPRYTLQLGDAALFQAQKRRFIGINKSIIGWTAIGLISSVVCLKSTRVKNLLKKIKNQITGKLRWCKKPAKKKRSKKPKLVASKIVARATNS